MDFVYLALAAAFWLVLAAMARGCAMCTHTVTPARARIVIRRIGTCMPKSRRCARWPSA